MTVPAEQDLSAAECESCGAPFTADNGQHERPHGPFTVNLCRACVERYDRYQRGEE